MACHESVALGSHLRVVGLAAVVGIGGGDVVVARFEMHVAVAQAAIEPPLRCELPAGLHIGVEIQILLVSLRRILPCAPSVLPMKFS